jgi:hypothetical protein
MYSLKTSASNPGDITETIIQQHGKPTCPVAGTIQLQ